VGLDRPAAVHGFEARGAGTGFYPASLAGFGPPVYWRSTLSPGLSTRKCQPRRDDGARER
jgi:hypothetical protein